MQDDKPSKNAVTFEGAKLYLKQDGRGFVLSILVHPNEVPMDLMMAPINTRYTVAMVEMADDGSVVEPKLKSEGEKLVASAGMLCKNERFIKWLAKNGAIDAEEEIQAEQFVRSHCGIKSRADLNTNYEARERFKKLRELFKDAVGYGKA
jgi:hypothetical protein